MTFNPPDFPEFMYKYTVLTLQIAPYDYQRPKKCPEAPKKAVKDNSQLLWASLNLYFQYQAKFEMNEHGIPVPPVLPFLLPSTPCYIEHALAKNFKDQIKINTANIMLQNAMLSQKTAQK